MIGPTLTPNHAPILAQPTCCPGICGDAMEDDGAMLMLLEWCERQLEEMDRDRDRERETELRHSDGTPITQGNL
jgi:hypothetical protein